MKRTKIYEGQRGKGNRTVVTVSGPPLPLRLDIVDHSPTGFEWGYAGAGPQQLSIAILADYLENDELVKKYYRSFTWDVIQHIKWDEHWKLLGIEVELVVDNIKRLQK